MFRSDSNSRPRRVCPTLRIVQLAAPSGEPILKNSSHKGTPRRPNRLTHVISASPFPERSGAPGLSLSPSRVFFFKHVKGRRSSKATVCRACPSFSYSGSISAPRPCEQQRLLIAAGKAAPTPPVGPALGARGVRSMDFCKEFNARTAHISPGVPIPTVINIHPDRSFTFVTKTPTVSYFLKKAAGIEKGTGRPGHETLGTVSLKHVYEIAKIKATDEHLKHLRLEAIASTIIGSARTLGVQVVP